MDQFKKAVSLARGSIPMAESPPQAPELTQALDDDFLPAKIRTVALNTAHLESMRIVSHSKEDLWARSFDMLRTQVLQAMDDAGWQILAVTSPTGGCGKTVTACNLALSIARLSERSVLLVDLDLRKPKVASYLGINRNFGVLSVLQGRRNLAEATVQATIGGEKILVLPGEATQDAAEWMASPTMSTLLQTIKREFRSKIVILDLPPILAGDDALALLPQLQCALMVAEAGSTSLSEIKECSRHLKTTPIVRVVLNKMTEREPTAPYHAYY